MKQNPILTSVTIFFVGLLFISGTGRDDIPLSKYFNFAKDSVFNCVGEVYYKNEFQISCVLIDKKYIITAAHAFTIDSGSFVLDSLYEEEFHKWRYGKHQQSEIIGDTNLYFIKLAGKKYHVRNIYIYDLYKNAHSVRDDHGVHPSEEYNFDIAIAELDSFVKGIKPAVLYDDNDELNKRAIISGFGHVERANQFNRFSLHLRRKMAGENMIDSIGGYKVGNNWAGLFFDFDAPNSNCCNRMGSSTPLSLEYFPNGGDCGSGLFINKNGIWKLAAVCSTDTYYREAVLYGQKYGKWYGFTCYYQRIFAYKDWIKEQMTKSMK